MTVLFLCPELSVRAGSMAALTWPTIQVKRRSYRALAKESRDVWAPAIEHEQNILQQKDNTYIQLVGCETSTLADPH